MFCKQHNSSFYNFFLIVLSIDVVPECEKSSATTYYWYREALDISDSISESGGLNWKMTLCLLAAWSMVCLAMIKGIQSSGKVKRIWFSVFGEKMFEAEEERKRTGETVPYNPGCLAYLTTQIELLYPGKCETVTETKGHFSPSVLENPLTHN